VLEGAYTRVAGMAEEGADFLRAMVMVYSKKPSLPVFHRSFGVATDRAPMILGFGKLGVIFGRHAKATQADLLGVEHRLGTVLFPPISCLSKVTDFACCLVSIPAAFPKFCQRLFCLAIPANPISLLVDVFPLGVMGQESPRFALLGGTLRGPRLRGYQGRFATTTFTELDHKQHLPQEETKVNRTQRTSWHRQTLNVILERR